MTNRNVLLLTVDGLRYDRLSNAGYERPTTPTLDDLASEGARCTNAISTGPGTLLSFPGILTSSYPLMYGGYAQLTDRRQSLAAAFRDRGYSTVGINTNAHLHRRFGWDEGFDVYVDTDRTVVDRDVGEFESEDAGGDESDGGGGGIGDAFDRVKTAAYESLDHEGVVYPLLESVYRRFSSRNLPHPTAEAVVDDALQAVERLPDDRPFFLWMHFMETHSPYLPPEQYRDRFLERSTSVGEIWSLNDRLHTSPDSIDDQEVEVISDLYDASLRYLDDEVSRLFDGLRDRGRWDDTHVALTADHGEQFREHGKLTHCAEPYEEGVHVPLLFRLDDEAASDVAGVTSTIDIGPTLLESAVDDADLPERFHGLSLVDALRGEDGVDDDRVVFTEQASSTETGPRDLDLDQRITGCRDRSWKFITSRQPAIDDKLFDLDADPGEQRNVVDERPDVVERFEAAIEEHYDDPAYDDFAVESAIDAGDLDERLQALGYKEN